LDARAHLDRGWLIRHLFVEMARDRVVPNDAQGDTRYALRAEQILERRKCMLGIAAPTGAHLNPDEVDVASLTT
jgi:hypothetical protein